MPFTVTMPKLSPTMDEGTVAKWHKQEGDFVQAGEAVLEVTTDKATVEHEAIDEGWLRKILVKEGETAVVNQPIAVFTAEEKESIKGYKPEGEMPSLEPQAVPEKEKVAKREPVAAGTMAQPAFEPLPPLQEYAFPAVPAGEKVVASPLARRLAAERHLDISTVAGSGPGGRVVERDLEKAQPAGTVAFDRGTMPKVKPGTYEEEGLSPIRKVIGLRLQQAKTFIPHFYVTQEIDAAALVDLRGQLKDEYDVKLSYNDFIMRAAALALREKPALNSGYNSVNEAIVRFKTIDISLAVSVEGGLITPIIRHADYKSLGQISAEVKSLAKKARAGKLQPEEYQGGSFTISNLGMYGVTDFMAVINPPQSSIMAVGGIRECPVVREGKVVPGHVLKVSVASDHRVVDGLHVAEFLATLKKFLESPAGLLV